ncbi:fermentation-respiration switch protein FrsA (DUF1100 family) [Duganella sp. 1224]|uniref:alpha/beta hydrolase n=1 Tax=Duganella sp. 1224 TaxID=2587052 RepID=UPI0015CE44B9|nr:alpha/beta hydrolase [Duganella sp. 1224]NYE60293.1 fermentation-respiration switch protein FrsA (DUF1100 family) [Duganella sp. 1224]
MSSSALPKPWRWIRNAGHNRALVIATPGSSVKAQIGANYAARLANLGFVTLAFDPSYQGQSEGEPRDQENPAARVEDIRCAAHFLMTLPFVAEDSLGLVGVCAGGGYAASAASTDHRFKALGTAQAMGVADRDLLDAIDYYRTPRGYNAHSTNRRYFTSLGPMLGFDAFQLASFRAHLS